MKKFLFVLAAMSMIAVAAFANNPGTVSKDYSHLAPFDRIDVSSTFKVNLSRGNTFSVVVTVDESMEKYLDVRVREGELIVKLSDGNGVWRKRITDNVYLKVDITMPSLRGIDLSGVSELWSDDEWNLPAGEFEIELSGCSKIHDFKVNAQKLEVDASGASKIDGLSGKFRELDADVSGASAVNMKVVADEVDLDVSGASKIDLDANAKLVKADASGASKVKLHGKIGELRGESSGASSIDTYDAEIGRVYLR